MPKKAVQIVLSDNREITMRSPTNADMGAFMRAMPAFASWSASGSGGAMPPEAFAGLWPLIGSLSGLSEDEIINMPLWDGLALIQGFAELMPESFFQKTPRTSLGGNGSAESETSPLPDGSAS